MRPCNVEDAENFAGMEQVDEEGTQLYNGVKLGEYCCTDIQVAINEGNRRGDDFFVIRVGKAGSSMPFQQPIPLDFARYHPKLHLKNVTMEAPGGRSWVVIVRAHKTVVRFGKGWRQFSVENSLREGCQLLFTLVGKLHFVVKFFDKLGKSYVSFPPLAGAVELQSVPRDEEHADEPPSRQQTPLATPPSTRPATPQARPAAAAASPQGRLGALNSQQAKAILRQFLPQPPEAPNSMKPTVATEELEEDAFNSRSANDMETEHVGNQGTHVEEQATAEKGKNFINLDDSDDDDERCRISPEASFTPANWNVPRAVSGTPSGMRGDIYPGMNNNDEESYSGERTGFHTPGNVHTVRPGGNATHFDDYLQEHAAETHHDSEEEEDHFSDSDIPLQHLQRQRRAQKKVSVKYSLWEGKAKGKGKRKGKGKGKGNQVPHFARFDDVHGEKAAARRSSRRGYHKGTYSSARRAVHAVKEEEDSMGSLSAANRLLQQQWCGNDKFSQIVSKCKRRPVLHKQRTGVLNAAKRFASGLENEKFLVVMRDNQVYHGFHLAIPRKILEVTGTQRAKKVKVSLMDKQKTIFIANWEWHAFCETPLLNSDAWAKFALDHTLEEGDVCVFELSNTEPAFMMGFLFCVHIFRVADQTPVKVDVSSSHGRLHHRSQTPFNNTLEMKSGSAAAAAGFDPDWEPRYDWEPRHHDDDDDDDDRGTKRPIDDVDRHSLQQRRARKQACNNVQPSWTRFINPRMQGDHFGGSRGLRQF